jgi:hypothetical protein
MRVNQARRGPLDCEEFYPTAFLNRFRQVIGSASRFARRAGSEAEPALMRTFIREVWRHQYQDGMRVDLINVHEPMVFYYQRLGYELLCNSFFKHPRLGTNNHVMCLIACSEAPAGLGQLFEGVDLLQTTLLRANLNFCPTIRCGRAHDPLHPRRFQCLLPAT